MAADQAFMDRLHRIETGRTWIPDGVLVEERGDRRKRKSINAGQKRVSFVLSLGLIWGLVWVFSQVQPELYAQMVAGDLSAVTGLLQSEPAEAVTGP